MLLLISVYAVHPSTGSIFKAIDSRSAVDLFPSKRFVRFTTSTTVTIRIRIATRNTSLSVVMQFHNLSKRAP